MKQVITRRSLLAVAAVGLLAVPSVAEARAWGANGYATRAARRRREEEENQTAIRALQLERTLLVRHKHATHAEKLLDHVRLAEIEKELEWRRSRSFY